MRTLILLPESPGLWWKGRLQMQVKGLYLFNIKKRRLRISIWLRLNSSVACKREQGDLMLPGFQWWNKKLKIPYCGLRWSSLLWLHSAQLMKRHYNICPNLFPIFYRSKCLYFLRIIHFSYNTDNESVAQDKGKRSIYTTLDHCSLFRTHWGYIAALYLYYETWIYYIYFCWG